MRPARLRAFESRTSERVAVHSSEQPADAVLNDQQTELFRREEAAWQWFSAQPAAYRRAAAHWVLSAKREETRQHRLAQLISDSAAGRTVPPLTRRRPVPTPDRHRPTSPGGDVNLYSWPRLTAEPQPHLIRPWRHPSR